MTLGALLEDYEFRGLESPQVIYCNDNDPYDTGDRIRIYLTGNNADYYGDNVLNRYHVYPKSDLTTDNPYYLTNEQIKEIVFETDDYFVATGYHHFGPTQQAVLDARHFNDDENFCDVSIYYTSVIDDSDIIVDDLISLGYVRVYITEPN